MAEGQIPKAAQGRERGRRVATTKSFMLTLSAAWVFGVVLAFGGAGETQGSQRVQEHVCSLHDRAVQSEFPAMTNRSRATAWSTAIPSVQSHVRA